MVRMGSGNRPFGINLLSEGGRKHFREPYRPRKCISSPQVGKLEKYSFI